MPQRIDFFCTFCDFQSFFDKLLTILGRFWDPHGLIFWWFSRIQFWYRFLDVFWEKMQYLKKWKHSSGPVNYSVLWRSPGSKKNIQLSNKCIDFSSLFDENLKWRGSIWDSFPHSRLPWGAMWYRFFQKEFGKSESQKSKNIKNPLFRFQNQYFWTFWP